jgi:Kip1 ubiquitination-promoting complex protein 1
VGRIGAKQACLDLTSKFGEVLQSSRDDLDIEAISQFVSIRANVGVFSGCYYYEVMLKTMGLMQIGWSTIQTPFTSHRGVGDDPTSFAYDGFRVKKWNKDNLAYGEAWSIGDVIGTLIDF